MKLLLVSLVSGLLGIMALPPGARAADRPNILWLVSEDNNRFLGCYGDPLARTPTLDKLASQGVLYRNCFALSVCAPSRFTLITGMNPVTCGPAEHMRSVGKIPPWLKGFPAYLRQAGYFTSNSDKTDYNSAINVGEAWNENGPKAGWEGRQPGQPFFSVFNHNATHESSLFPKQGKPLDFPATDPAKVRVPPYQPDTPEIRADWARYYDCLKLMDGQIAAKLKRLETDGLSEDTIIFYYSDNGGVLPRSKRSLQESGTHVPLIVYYPPKWRHLAPAPPGSTLDQPVGFVDFAPTVLSLAGVKAPEYMQGRAFAGPARATNEFVVCSRDRMDEFYDMRRSVMTSRLLYIRNYRPDLPYVQPLDYMFTARGYQSWAQLAGEGKLTPATAAFWGQKPAEELYDMATDPDNIHNLAGDPGRQTTLATMRAHLGQWVIANKDNGFLPEGSVLEGYEASRVPGAFDIGQVYALANIASERNPANLSSLIKALGDDSEPVRWWAAQGCTMLGTNAAPAASALRKCLADPSGAVQVAAAEAMARLGKVDEALPVLERWLQQTNHQPFALQAGNVMVRLGESARPALPVARSVRAALANAERKPSAGVKVGRGKNVYPDYLARVLEYYSDVLEGRVKPLVYPDVSANPLKQ